MLQYDAMLSMTETFDAELVQEETLDAELCTALSFDAELLQMHILTTGGGDYPHYDGAYDITPLVTSQVLPTKEKVMDGDVLIRMIPTNEEKNSAGGVTFKIGSD